MKYTIESIDEVRSLARNVLQKILKHKSNMKHATVIALNGELGAGKTTFAKQFAKELGIKEHVISPTFVIQKSYIIDNNGVKSVNFTKLFHIDAYRLNGLRDARILCIEDTMQNPDHIVLIEWPENIKGALPDDIVNLNFKYIDATVREVTID